MSSRLKAVLVVVCGVPLAIMACALLAPPAAPTLLAPPAQIRSLNLAAAQTAAAYRTRTPTVREQEQQATAAAGNRITPTPAPRPTTPPTPAPRPTAPPLTPAPRPTAPPPTPAPLVGAAVVPTPIASPDAGALAQRIGAYLQAQADSGAFSGVVLAARDGQVLFQGGFGMADAERGVPNTPQTVFRLGSITKQFTAMAILLLAADGKLSLEDPACRYLDNCPPAWAPITIRHLLTHTSGLPNYTDFDDFDATEGQPATPAQLIARFRDLPLNFAPGTDYSYCNSGYVLLGAIIERVSGESYESFLTRRIFGPLGMEHTGYDHDPLGISGRAIGYVSPGDRAAPLDLTTLFAAGALSSTVGDLLKWDRALAAGRLLPPALQQAMFTPFRNDYGYGWKVVQRFGRRAQLHDGLVSGFSTNITRFPDDGVVVITLSNYQAAPAAAISQNVAGMIFDRLTP